MTTQNPENLVTVSSTPTEFEAHTIVAVLREAGIEAFAFGTSGGSLPLGGVITSVPVQVRQSDLHRARLALRQNVADSVDLDWDEVDVGERKDELPLRPVGQMPLLAKVAFAVAAMLILLTLLLWILAIIL